MSNLVSKVKRLSRNLLIPTLAATTFSGCGLAQKILGSEEKNEAPETEVYNANYIPGGNGLRFNAWGSDKEDKFASKIEFRVVGENYSSEWKQSFSSENVVGFHNLSPGDYVLEIRAIDNENKPDSTPERRNFTVQGENSLPETELTPIYDENERGIRLNFNGSDSDGFIRRYEILLEGPRSQNWVDSDLAKNLLQEMPDGNYTFKVRSVDNKGGKDPTPAEYDFHITNGFFREGHREVSIPDLITEPIEVRPDNTRVFRGVTNENGLVSFIDETSEDGKAEVEVINEETKKRASMDITYFDNPEFKLFVAEDSEEQLMPTMYIAPHNSLQTLKTTPMGSGRQVLMQVIDDEETTRAWYKFETNQQLAANPFRKYEYTETIDENERIKKRDKNLTWIRRVDKVNNFVGIAGIKFPFKFEDLAPIFDPYVSRDKIKSRSWDVYRRSYGTEFTPERVEDILLIPSNSPKVEISSLVKHNYSTTVFWTASDDTIYSMPFDLPDVIDLTTFLGPTLGSDLHLDYALQKNNEIIEQGNPQEERDERGRETGRVFSAFSDLQEGNYTFIGRATDEVGNTSADTLEFRIEQTQVEIPTEPISEPEPFIEDPQPLDLSNKIVFISDREAYGNVSEYTSLFLIDPEGNNLERLSNYNNFVSPRWSPTGDRISFSTIGRNSRVNIMEMRTGEIKQLNIETKNYSWSPNGNEIAYVNEDFGKEVRIQNIHGTDRVIMEDLSVIGSPDWSIDDKIIVSGMVNESEIGLISIDSGGNNRINLTEGRKGGYYESKWSPDGRRIAFIHQAFNENKVYAGYVVGVMDADGNNERILTDREYDYSYNTEIKWSPDGRRIALLGEPLVSDGKNIYVLDLNNGENRNTTEDIEEISDFSWSPDGREIVYDSRGDIFIMNSDGANKRNITNSPEDDDWGPDWSPY